MALQQTLFLTMLSSERRDFNLLSLNVTLILMFGGDAGVCLWAVHGATELRVFTVVAFCAAWNGGGVL